LLVGGPYPDPFELSGSPGRARAIFASLAARKLAPETSNFPQTNTTVRIKMQASHDVKDYPDLDRGHFRRMSDDRR
jgi:hypothetical protein